ncbi:hypothetical protein LVD17_26100 [Fulvivirga ulvae]|uniref:hypothetical protein n=1 Tax=Fulvivirga ulvae TaxID=2904245 RepID=UPI001F316CFE|nr:hypothetical protein [Fulvivirga ulvae]UII31765.1 hypothetical protein LVD17_26100 [Fulvivirga ulvae]
MLEALTILTLGKSISAIARKKGLKPGRYIVIMLVLLLGMEVAGAAIGVILYGDGPLIYVFALTGAALGGFLSYQAVRFVSPVSSLSSDKILDADLKD